MSTERYIHEFVEVYMYKDYTEHIIDYMETVRIAVFTRQV